MQEPEQDPETRRRPTRTPAVGSPRNPQEAQKTAGGRKKQQQALRKPQEDPETRRRPPGSRRRHQEATGDPSGSPRIPQEDPGYPPGRPRKPQ